MRLQEKISIHFTELTKTDRKITGQLIEKPEILIQHSVQEAANLLEVSPAAIMRVAKKLKYRGLAEFKQSLEIYQSEMQNKEEKNETHNFSKSVISGFKSQLDAIEKSVSEKGIGSSGLSAEQFVYSLLYQDHYMEAVTSRTKIFYLSRILTADDVLIIFSVSGNSEAYSEIIERSQKTGAKLVFITMNHDKKLKEAAEVVVVLPSNITDFSVSHHLQQLDNRFAFYIFSSMLAAYIDNGELD